MTHALAIPPAEMAEFAKLPSLIKRDVGFWMELLARVAIAERPHQAIKEEARRHAHVRGCSVPSIRRKYDLLRHGASWRCLVDHAKHPAAATRQSPAFLDFWRGLCERNQRASRPAFRSLLFDHYYQEKPIPGVGTWRDVWRLQHEGQDPPAAMPKAPPLPEGWSERNLMRYLPSRFELEAARIGRGAAARYRPLVFSTRAGLRPGQFYMFDDVEHDIKVNFLGVNRRAMRPLELCCLDVFSGAKIAYGCKPTIEGDDGAKQKLKEREMHFLLAYVLTELGYLADGTTLMVEHGTAAIREPLEQILSDLSAGKIKVERSGLFMGAIPKDKRANPFVGYKGAAAFAGVFESRAIGNSRFKAALESHHNLVHNELAALPGQMGKDRDHAPEELHGRGRYNDALINAALALPPERAALLRYPFLEYHQFLSILDELYKRIDARTEHELEGWVEAGLVAHEFRVSDGSDWLPLAVVEQLPEEQRRAVEAVACAPGHGRVRRLSPGEVWRRGRADLVKLPGYCVPLILGDALGREVKISGSLIEFEDQELGPGQFRYLLDYVTPEGHPGRLLGGETYLFHVNPFNPREIYVSRAGAKAGAFLGTCQRWEAPSKDDVDALHRQMGAARKMEAELLAPVARRGAELIRRRIEMHQHNAGVLAGAAITEPERALAARVRGEKGDIGEMIPAQIAAAPEADQGDDDGGMNDLL
jgi:hypothetical protein